ncbi:hypothetical protein BN109_002 [Yersinia phage phi80-18]|uniref:Uncharacterized protein n=1 Tax=Yersinia phage phi80-18 TaxID=1206559 RepID=I7J416_9CAUD|nr:hypothetical protein BN109_002 [Yersinia phage phi80-18]CCI88838.1 hypothetical protein BN109_002 [Yersinia phage phi80-18]
MTTATKATNKPALTATKISAPSMTAKELDAAIKSVCDDSVSLQDRIHDVAVEIMLHTHKHGDYTRAQSLVDNLGKGIRAKALVEWFHKAGLTVDDVKGFTAFNKPVMVKNWEVCLKTRWYSMKPENPFAGFDLDAEIAKLIKRAEAAVKKNEELPADAERAEDFKMNVVADKLATLRTLAGVTLQ